MNILRINHYWARDLLFFNERKLNRVHVLGKNHSASEAQQKINSLIEINHEYSKIYDDSIEKYIEPLKHRMFSIYK